MAQGSVDLPLNVSSVLQAARQAPQSAVGSFLEVQGEVRLSYSGLRPQAEPK